MWIEDTRDILRRFRLFLCLVLVIGCTVRAGISQEMGCQTFKKVGRNIVREKNIQNLRTKKKKKRRIVTSSLL